MNFEPRIVAIDAGTYFHHATFHDPRFAPYFDTVAYAPELTTKLDWMESDALFIASRQDPERMLAAQPLFSKYLDAGKTMAVMGDSGAESWLPGVVWRPSEVNFWWWLTPGADSGLRVGAPEHALFKYITLGDATWHQHGYLEAPAGAASLVERVDGGSILYEDRVSNIPTESKGIMTMPGTFSPGSASTPGSS